MPPCSPSGARHNGNTARRPAGRAPPTQPPGRRARQIGHRTFCFEPKEGSQTTGEPVNQPDRSRMMKNRTGETSQHWPDDYAPLGALLPPSPEPRRPVQASRDHHVAMGLRDGSYERSVSCRGSHASCSMVVSVWCVARWHTEPSVGMPDVGAALGGPAMIREGGDGGVVRARVDCPGLRCCSELARQRYGHLMGVGARDERCCVGAQHGSLVTHPDMDGLASEGTME